MKLFKGDIHIICIAPAARSADQTLRRRRDKPPLAIPPRVRRGLLAHYPAILGLLSSYRIAFPSSLSLRTSKQPLDFLYIGALTLLLSLHRIRHLALCSVLELQHAPPQISGMSLKGCSMVSATPSSHPSNTRLAFVLLPWHIRRPLASVNLLALTSSTTASSLEKILPASLSSPRARRSTRSLSVRHKPSLDDAMHGRSMTAAFTLTTTRGWNGL